MAKYRAAGFQQIKVYSLLTPAIVAAICAEAHRLGMTVTGHVPTGMSIEQAVSAGMDQIAHLPIRGEAGTPDVSRRLRFSKPRNRDRSDAVVERIARPCGRHADRAVQPRRQQNPVSAQSLFSNAGSASIDAATARGRVERGLRIVRALHDAGVPVVVGTDEGIARAQRASGNRAVCRSGTDADAGAAVSDDRASARDEDGSASSGRSSGQARRPRHPRMPTRSTQIQQHPPRTLDSECRPDVRSRCFVEKRQVRAVAFSPPS